MKRVNEEEPAKAAHSVLSLAPRKVPCGAVTLRPSIYGPAALSSSMAKSNAEQLQSRSATITATTVPSLDAALPIRRTSDVQLPPIATSRSPSQPNSLPKPPPATTNIGDAPPAQGKQRMMPVLIWKCQDCGSACNVMKSENRCICGHRFREHNVKKAAGAIADGKASASCPCTVMKCPCKDFFYMVAEGAWILRCRCKHKHTEHEPNPPFKCLKCKPTNVKGNAAAPGTCGGFDSPFVCNCNHPWVNHKQVWELRQLAALPEVLDEFGDPSIVKRGLE